MKKILLSLCTALALTACVAISETENDPADEVSEMSSSLTDDGQADEDMRATCDIDAEALSVCCWINADHAQCCKVCVYGGGCSTTCGAG